MQGLLYIAAGGAIGAVLRFLVSETTIRHMGIAFPWGTITVNLIGCLLIGIIWGTFQAFEPDNNIKLFVLTGLLGAFTTFSTFAVENFNLLRNGDMQMLVLNISISNIIGILLVFVGFYMSTSILAGLNK